MINAKELSLLTERAKSEAYPKAFNAALESLLDASKRGYNSYSFSLVLIYPGLRAHQVRFVEELKELGFTIKYSFPSNCVEWIFCKLFSVKPEPEYICW